MRADPAALIGVSFEGPTVLAMHARTLALSAMVLAFAAACGGQESPATDKPAPPTGTEAAPRELPQGGEPVTLDPADFTNQVDNPYWPMAPGSRWVYRETDAEGAKLRVEVTVTSKKKMIMGIDALVVHDVVSEDGQLVEDTDDWYAQDSDGNVWYLGEDTKEYEHGKVKSTEGSWEAGVDGAQAGIILPADPMPGMKYRQEYYEGEAEDAGEILSLDAKATVPYGAFDHLLQTKDRRRSSPT